MSKLKVHFGILSSPYAPCGAHSPDLRFNSDWDKITCEKCKKNKEQICLTTLQIKDNDIGLAEACIAFNELMRSNAVRDMASMKQQKYKAEQELEELKKVLPKDVVDDWLLSKIDKALE